VSFEEAVTIDRDPRILTRPDPHHSIDEERWTGIGLSNKGRLLWVAFTDRHDRMWPITARRATKRERHEYLYRSG
jgi:hypothetical protein